MRTGRSFRCGRRRLNLCTLAVIALVGLLSYAAVAAAAQQVTVIAVGYKAGLPTVDLVLAVPKSIDSQARLGGRNWQVRVTVSYSSAEQTFETLDSGPVPVTDLTPGANIDSHTVAEGLGIQLGATPPPGGSPGYTTTVELISP